jgi:hypothetical protein
MSKSLLVLAGVLAGIAAVARSQAPEVQRYLNVRKM